MTVVRGFVITVVSGSSGTLAGSGIGFILGNFAPDYYRAVFRIPQHVELDPIQIGIGLGLTQGLGAGLAVGLIIVLAVAWYHSRSQSP